MILIVLTLCNSHLAPSASLQQLFTYIYPVISFHRASCDLYPGALTLDTKPVQQNYYFYNAVLAVPAFKFNRFK